MKSLAEKMMKLFRDEEGATAVEYAVMIALIIVVCIVAITAIGTNANVAYQNVAGRLGAAVPAGS